MKTTRQSTFGATLRTAGAQTLFATQAGNSSISGSSALITVGPSTATHFTVAAPATAITGITNSVTVTAVDHYGNIAAGYAGTVKLSNSDSALVPIANYTFTTGASADNGVHTFTGLVLRTKGVQTVTITDLWNGTIFGTISVDVPLAVNSATPTISMIQPSAGLMLLLTSLAIGLLGSIWITPPTADLSTLAYGQITSAGAESVRRYVNHRRRRARRPGEDISRCSRFVAV